jgi:hypothetical protein
MHKRPKHGKWQNCHQLTPLCYLSSDNAFYHIVRFSFKILPKESYIVYSVQDPYKGRIPTTPLKNVMHDLCRRRSCFPNEMFKNIQNRFDEYIPPLPTKY